MSHHDDHASTSLTTRLGWLGLGAVIGAAVAHLADPDRGAKRRNDLTAQARSLLGDSTDTLDTAATRAADQARGAAAATAGAVTPQDVPDDPKLLRQRIRSVAFGHHDDTDDVVVVVDQPGHVVLKGTVRGEASRDSLLAAVRDVEGVIDLRSELTVTG